MLLFVRHVAWRLSWVLAGLTLAQPAGAEEPMSVVVLPFTTSDDELAIYGKPVAEVVATGLAGRAGVTVLAAGVEGGRSPPSIRRVLSPSGAALGSLAR